MYDKNARIELRVTQSEKKKIARLAESCGLSQSEYIRQRTLGYAPRTVLPDVFFDFYQTLCRLCDEVADKVSPDTERKLLEVVDAIQQRLLLPEKSSAKQICKEVTAWQQQASGPSKDSYDFVCSTMIGIQTCACRAGLYLFILQSKRDVIAINRLLWHF